MFLKLTVLFVLLTIVSAIDQFHETFQWKTIDIVWPSEEIRTRVYDRNEFIPVNNAIAGVKFWKGKMYLTIPRFKEGVPVTLGVTSAQPINRTYSPALIPYPNWDMQTIGDCKALQFVQSMEIDPNGRMWILDTGRTATMSTEPKARCPPRLVIIDIENNGEILRSFTFPTDVTSYDTVFLNDIVLDYSDGGYAYITDSSKNNPGIIVFSLRDNKSWKINHDSMKAQNEAIQFMVGSERLRNPINIDGIALSPVDAPIKQLYYSPLSSFHLYSVPTFVLKNNTKNIDNYVRELGRKSSQTDGMMMSANGILYFGLLADDAVAMWDSRQFPSFTTGQRIISRDHSRMRWPDTFAFDENGDLWCVTNELQNYMNNKVDGTQPNYRLIRISTGYKSYQYHENGSAPEQPIITAGASDHVAMAMGTILLVFITLSFK